MKSLYESILDINTDNVTLSVKNKQKQRRELTKKICEIFYKYLGEYSDNFTKGAKKVSVGWEQFGENYDDDVRIDLADEADLEKHLIIVKRSRHAACLQLIKELSALFKNNVSEIRMPCNEYDYVFKMDNVTKDCDIDSFVMRRITGNVDIYRPIPRIIIPKTIHDILRKYKK